MNIRDDIARFGNLTATHELLGAGWTSRQLTRLVRDGAIVRVRQGWYALPETDPVLVRAARVGGRLTCVSGAQRRDLAVFRTSRIHVSVPPHGGRLRSPADHRARLAERPTTEVVVHWRGSSNGDRFERDPLGILLDMAFCQSIERTIAAADSALRKRLITIRQWHELLSRLPQGLAVALSAVDARSESLTESLCRVRLTALGIRTALQVRIPGVGRVDLVIGERLVIEVDGAKYHTDPDKFEEDRRRDARLSAHGYRVLRFSYRQITQRWSEVRAAIAAAMARGDHL